jgi:hypothetical protein
MKPGLRLKKRPIWISSLVMGVLLLSGNCKEIQTRTADIYVDFESNNIKQ